MTDKPDNPPEPLYIAQTFEHIHTHDEAARLTWWRDHAEEATKQGGTFPRYTISDDGRGILFECWKERPKDQGPPRWQAAEREKRDA